MSRTVTIDHSDPEQVAAMNAVWRLSDDERAAIRSRAEYAAKRLRITQQYGLGAVVAWQMTGVDPETRAERTAA
jgi:hypothetical protein